jgi:hypothetical protein
VTSCRAGDALISNTHVLLNTTTLLAATASLIMVVCGVHHRSTHMRALSSRTFWQDSALQPAGPLRTHEPSQMRHLLHQADGPIGPAVRPLEVVRTHLVGSHHTHRQSSAACNAAIESLLTVLCIAIGQGDAVADEMHSLTCRGAHGRGDGTAQT